MLELNLFIMEEYLLDVPLCGQKEGYDGTPSTLPNRFGEVQLHGFKACWYWSACMVSYYFSKGPRMGIPKLWYKDRGISVKAIDELADIEGLSVLERPESEVRSDFLLRSLQKHGPIWAAGYYLEDNPKEAHAIVLTGVKGNDIYYNDPWEPESKVKSVNWFDSRLLNFPNVLLVKNRDRF